MGLILAAVGALILGLFVLVLALASIPWLLSVTARSSPVGQMQVEVRPFSPRFPLRLRFDKDAGSERADNSPGRKKARTDRARPRPRKAGRSKRGSGERGRRWVLRMLRASPGLLARLLSVFRFERLKVHGRVGLADPADTGQLFGLIMPVSYILPAPLFAIDVEPDFGGPALDGEAEAILRIVPIRVVPPAVRFAWQVFVRPG